MAFREIPLDEQILQGDQIARFLRDETVLRVKAGLELDYFDEWKAAKTPADAEEIRAKSRVLDDLWAALGRVVARGDHAKHEVAQRDKLPPI